jgi:thioredoxin reductase
VADLAEAHRPRHYPVVVVGSGPAGIQTSYFLSRLGIVHALISEDPAPGGMFRSYPVFQRLITWSKLHAPADRDSAAYEWFDWNSLLADEPRLRALVPKAMDGSSYFPSRSEMERAIASFAERAGVQCRYGCSWESTRRTPDGFVLTTSNGQYHARLLILAVGMAQPWKPRIEGMEAIPHYVDVGKPPDYADRRVLLVGKRNSAFELADGLLPFARQIVLVSPRPARLSVFTHSTAAARARYLQPYEDSVLGGGNVVLDAGIRRIERMEGGYRVHVEGTTSARPLVLDVDAVIAATGFQVPLQDLRDLGVATFYQDRLPAQTPFWESATVPGIYFAGAITQGSIGLKKNGIPSNSSAVHGFRYNARVLVRHLAETHFGMKIPRPTVGRDAIVARVLAEASRAPDIWNQQAYLARVFELPSNSDPIDAGTLPLAHFVDATGPDAVAVTIETGPGGDIYPAIYVRRGTSVSEHLLPPDPLRDYETAQNRAEVRAILTPWL